MVSARPSQGVPAMKRFLICFRVEQTFTASIEVEAASGEDARNGFYRGTYEAPRFAAELDLVESKDTITLDRMQARIAQRPDIRDRRRETVEPPFGTIKQWMNQGAFLMRGLEKVRAEFSLTALAYNLRRVLNIVAFPDLIAALQA
jgi:hypothetical protein